ncbi:SDR family NAD(P)-dependent oxidoreductase [Rhodocaloribacter litoris]|uniref:SDR family oxidoreductase n=1 Tax=Rhodocaloribacter litoris TaxID=2558931 RepID=UPI00141F8AC5|nr:SDR family NAD(P)-dependent oxidoreductase [Rhodocaloribacter litoris]QXD16827.1 SDR family NAD(P)-dependent oxidoreductase [Rhodocaloribacter litoris]
MNLQDKVAVVTGASSGLGRVFSQMLVERGARVFGLARRQERLEAVREALGERFHPVVCDVTDEAAVARAFETIRREGGRLDVLINNAGLGKFGPVDRLSVEDWDVQVATNLRGVFLCTRAAVPVMKQQNAETGFGGHIVNIASIAGLIGNPNISAYNATKFGLRGFSEALMKELRDDGIKVSCVYPGSIATEFFQTSGSNPAPNAMTAEDVGRTVMHLLETPDNYLISEVVMRPLRPRG